MTDLELPKRMIAAGHDPLGEKVNVYNKMFKLRAIIAALRDDEREFISKSSLGKLLEIPSMPSWSAGFGLFLLSRQLDVSKEKEIWIVFAGTPVRFSLREFKIVTGLPCGKFPPKQKKKKKGTAGVKIPFYSTLFGLEDDVTVDRVISMLSKKNKGDFDVRIRYACLALVDGFLLPTSHYPKVIKEHVEMIEDIDEFLAYPWGRASFDMIMSSVKERDVAQLATTSVAVQGFFYALQLVVLQAAPAIQEGVNSSQVVCAESDDDFLFGNRVRDAVPFKLGNAREVDEQCEAHVDPIICPEYEVDIELEDLSWSDEEEDETVDNLVRLAKEGFQFCNEMFTGGCIPADLIVPRKTKRAATSNTLRRRGVGKQRGVSRITQSSRRDRNNHSQAQASDTGLVSMEKLNELLDKKLDHFSKYIVNSITEWFVGNIVVDTEATTGTTKSQDLGKRRRRQEGSNSRDVNDYQNENPNENETPAGGEKYQGVGKKRRMDEMSNPLHDQPIENINDYVSKVAGFYESSSEEAIDDLFAETEVASKNTRVPLTENIISNQEMEGDRAAPKVGNNQSNENLSNAGDSVEKPVEANHDLTGIDKEDILNNNSGTCISDDPMLTSTKEKPLQNNNGAIIADDPPVGSVEEDVQQSADVTTDKPADTPGELLAAGESLYVQESGSIKGNLGTYPDGSIVDDGNEQMSAVPVVCGDSISVGQEPSEVVDAAAAQLKVDAVTNFGTRRSKRLRTISSRLDGRYQCDKKTKTAVGQPSGVPNFGNDQDELEERFKKSMEKLKESTSRVSAKPASLSNREIYDIIEQKKEISNKVMDVLLTFSRHLLRSDDADGEKLKVEVLDSKFVSQVAKLYTKFLKAANPEEFIFPDSLIASVIDNGTKDRIQLFTEADTLYLPFNFDKKHWVALCVDLKASLITVLDCNIRGRPEASVLQDIQPLAIMLPYLFRQALPGIASEDESVRPLSIYIEEDLPQLSGQPVSGLMSIFLIHAHATGGIDECRDLEIPSLATESKKLLSAMIQHGFV